MKRILTALVAGVILMIMSGSNVSAQNTYDPKIQDRTAEQQRRIDQGISSGQLTRHEIHILQDNLNWIKNEEARLKADGVLTYRERLRLHRMLDRNSDMIFKKKHNPIRRLYP